MIHYIKTHTGIKRFRKIFIWKTLGINERGQFQQIVDKVQHRGK